MCLFESLILDLNLVQYLAGKEVFIKLLILTDRAIEQLA